MGEGFETMWANPLVLVRQDDRTFLPGTDSSDPRPLIEGLEPPYDEPSADDALPPDAFGVAERTPPPPRPWVPPVILGLGLALLVTGIAFVIAGSIVSQSTGSFNAVCAHVPGCHAGDDLSAGLDAGAVGLIVVGALLVIIGYRRSLARRSWEPETE